MVRGLILLEELCSMVFMQVILSVCVCVRVLGEIRGQFIYSYRRANRKKDKRRKGECM